ncbi:MAG: hypothetical protein Tsb0019_30450 [Roseibium sp.]
MTPSWLIFMTFMTLALLLMVAGYVSALLFFDRRKLLEQDGLHPVRGVGMWLWLFRRGGFGAEAEPARRRIARLYLLSVLAFAVAVLLFVVLPVVPG